MAYVLKQMLVASSKYSVKCPHSMTAEYITIHNTYNDASAESEVKYMIGNNNQVSFHYAVDDKYVVQGLPINRNAWACGDGANGAGNRKSINVEICYSKSGGSRFTEAEKNAAKFVASLLKERGWGVSKVKKHQDWSGKYCPHRTLDNGWTRFVNMIQSELNALNTPSSSSGSSSSSADFKVGDYNRKVKVTADSLNVRSKRDASSSIVGTLAKGTVVEVGYIMYENNQTSGNSLWGGVVVNGKQGFINLKYVEPVVEQVAQPKPFAVGGYDAYAQTTDSLNVRSKRNASSTILGTLSKGEKVKVNYIMYEGDKTTGNSLWGSIDYKGKTGFINLKYTNPVV